MSKNIGTCFLCGGRVRNGICTECGMDNRKSDDSYRLNTGECDREPLTHVHVHEKEESEKKEKVKKAADSERKKTGNSTARSAGERPKNYGKYYHSSGKKPAAKKTGLWVVIIIAVIGILPNIGKSVYDAYQEKRVEETLSSIENLQDFQDSYDPYQYVDESIPEEGEYFQAELSAGYYQIGIDLPEGIYKCTRKDGTGYINIVDSEHNVYQYESFQENDPEEITDLKMFQGAVLQISGGAVFTLETENGQTSSMEEAEPNPLTDELTLEGYNAAGTDFPPGTYDVSAPDDFGLLEIELPGGGESPYTISFLLDSQRTEEYPGYSQEVRHLYLPEGTKVSAEGFEIKMVPSERRTSLDYKVYYGLW